jgi:hypothetical protein
VTTVAEAAFQDKVWRPRLEPLKEMAQFRIVHCTVDAAVAFERSRNRLRDTPTRRAHADPRDPAEHAATHRAFDRVSIDAPYLEVDTTGSYRPALNTIVAFVNDHGRQ